MALHRQSLNLLKKCFTQRILIKNQTDIRGMKRWVAPTLREIQVRKDKMGVQPPKPRSTFLEWNYDAEIYAFGGRLGETFQLDLLKQALTHRTYIHLQEIKQKEQGITSDLNISDNKEMIENGEQILKRFVRKSFENKYPKIICQSIQNYLLSERILAQVGADIGLKDIILTAEFPVDQLTIANTFKAIISALNESTNLERTEIFIKDLLISQLNDKELFDLWEPENPYVYLQDICKNEDLDLEPRLCNKSASNTILANYQVGIYSNKKLLGLGWGESVEIAKDTAALDAIQKIYKKNSFL